jgi:hypothetical protein
MANAPSGWAWKNVIRQRSLWVALVLWVLLSLGGIPFHREREAVFSSIAICVLVLEMGLVAWLTRRRPMPDLAQRAPERALAPRETFAVWLYGAVVLVAGRLLGQHFFGEGIALHLNGSLVGATRVQSPREVYTWAAYNGFFLALIPYIVFRLRGYSREALNLKSANWKNDLLVICVVLAIGIGFDLTGPNIFELTRHQRLAGGLLSFVLHLVGTDLPIMIFIYAILVPRYFRLASPMTAFLLGAASYPAMHIFESWTHYDTPAHAAASVIMVFFTFFPPGLMKSFLTVRTGNAWVHMWGFHAISPHVTVDTRLIVRDFDIH